MISWLKTLLTSEQAPKVFTVLLVLGIALDLVLVTTGYKSISLRTWIIEGKHWTIIGAGNLATVLGMLWVRKSRISIGTVGLLGGHLFLHY